MPSEHSRHLQDQRAGNEPVGDLAPRVVSGSAKAHPPVNLRGEDPCKELGNLASAITGEPAAAVRSEPVEWCNRQGLIVRGYLDTNTHHDQGGIHHVIVIPAAYGETSRKSIDLGYSLAANGISTLRYDNSNHIGASEGNIFNTTLEQIKDDILSAIDYLDARFGRIRIGVLSFSLACRATIKAAALDDRITFMGCLMPVVNLQNTLLTIYQRDLVAEALSNARIGTVKILGFQIDADNFLKSAIQHGYHTFTTSLEDAKKVAAASLFFIGDEDPWISKCDVMRVAGTISSGGGRCVSLKSTLHRYRENVHAYDEVIRSIITEARDSILEESHRPIIMPSPEEIQFQRNKERQRTRQSENLAKSQEVNFWKNYLVEFQSIFNIPDYWHLLDDIAKMLRVFGGGNRLLDAGCGNGPFGSYMLVQSAYKHRGLGARMEAVAEYVGLDFVPEALTLARTTHSRLRDELSAAIRTRRFGLPSFSYVHADLEDGIPLGDALFDKVCCNLVLSYVADPLHVIRELFRVMKKEGLIILTSLKPNPDLSKIYSNFLQTYPTAAEVAEAQTLLNNAGLIEEKEDQGYYTFFSDQQLTALVQEAGGIILSNGRSFANQANVLLARKRS